MSTTRAVPGYPAYSVTDEGVVYTHKWHGSPRELRQCKATSGYVKVTLCHRNVPKTFLVHALVALAFLGEAKGRIVRHLDGNPRNNHLSNLAYGTFVDNEADKLRHGRRVMGERVARAKLTDALVLDLRARFLAGETIRALARRFGVNVTTASSAIHGGTWGHLPIPDYAARQPLRPNGSWNRGEGDGQAKLTAADVKRIRALRRLGVPQTVVAREFGVSRGCVAHIDQGKTWSHAA